MLCLLQCYQSLPREKITDKFLWGRLEPMLGYLSIEQRNKVLEGLNLAFDSHSGQVMHPSVAQTLAIVELAPGQRQPMDCLMLLL